MSSAVTVTTRPVTGGIESSWPMCRSSLDLRSLAHQMVIIETPNLRGDPGQRVAGLDLVGLNQAPTIGDRRVDGDRLEQRAVVEEWALDKGRVVSCRGHGRAARVDAAGLVNAARGRIRAGALRGERVADRWLALGDRPAVAAAAPPMAIRTSVPGPVGPPVAGAGAAAERLNREAPSRIPPPRRRRSGPGRAWRSGNGDQTGRGQWRRSADRRERRPGMP